MIILYAPQYRPIGMYYELPLGLGHISSYLKSKGLPVLFINENECQFMTDYRGWFIQNVKSATVFCTGGLSVHYSTLKKVIENVRQINPSIKIVMGGGLISSEPEIMARDFNADHVICGEGEIALYELLTGKLTDRIIRAESIKDIDELPMPDYDGLMVEQYLDRQLCGDEHYTYHYDKPRALPIISSRGCPYNCVFCYHPIGKKYRQRSINKFEEEVKYLKSRYKINTLCILDELISDNRQRLENICDVMRKYGLKWMTQMRVTNVDSKIASVLKKSGCFQLSLGIEHINNGILEKMQKKITREQIERSLRECYDAGIGIQGNILLGSPWETSETVKEVIEWQRVNKRYLINISPISPYPGSDLYNHYFPGKTDAVKLAYIQKGCPPIGAIPDGNVVHSYVVNENRMNADDIDIHHEDNDKYRGKLYMFTAKCPHCKKYVTYRNIYKGATGEAFLGGRGYRIGCRECNQRFDIKL